MQLDIIGTGLTLDSYDWNRESLKWGLSQYRGAYKGNIDLFFGMHENQGTNSDNEITLSDYPLQEIIEWSGSNYFTSSTAYMIAFAVYTGNKNIMIYGVDMEDKDEYRLQRPCIAYWIGFARAKGCKIETATQFTNPPYKYGYDTNLLHQTISSLQERIIATREKATNSDGREKDQWIGAMVAYQNILESLRS